MGSLFLTALLMMLRAHVRREVSPQRNRRGEIVSQPKDIRMLYPDDLLRISLANDSTASRHRAAAWRTIASARVAACLASPRRWAPAFLLSAFLPLCFLLHA